uniref:Cytochrome P450 6a2-like n=1 Tax=Diabrotica virgifera virgifera TaxID=50390 RepID=A0A6P7EZ34_DIAVI
MLVFLLVILVAFFYLYKKWIYTYWKRRGVYQMKPEFFYGNFKPMTTGKMSVAELIREIYTEIKAKGGQYGGFYQVFKPGFMPVDLDIIKGIVQKDFGHFMNHGNYTNPEVDPLSNHLFAMEGEEWRKMRSKLTPTFTTGKMKMMFPTMVACTQGLNEMLKDHASIQDAVDIKDLIARFTTDIIGSAAFGIDCNSLQDPNSDFRQFGKQVFEVTFWKRLKRLISTNLPKWLLDLIRLKMVDQALEDFFMGIVRSTIKFREQNNVYRRDFLHLMLQLKNKGKVTEDKDFKPVDEGLETTRENDDNFLTFNEVAAQCFVFFIAGFETSSTTISFALLELSKNPEIQDKLREEIRSVLKKHNNEFTYDAIMEMKYLDKVVNETLRIHPPASAIARICNTDYKVPNTDLIIKNGIKILVPIIGIHTDPDHYPNPNVFDPERFNEENKAKRHQFAFIPFGEGPRMCIGSRFGLLQSKVGISSIIKDFAVSLHQKTKLPIKYSPKSIISAVEGDVWLTVQLVNCVQKYSEHLFTMEGEKWKILRKKWTAAFTTGKMKMMFPILIACSENLKDVVDKHAVLDDAVDIKDIIARFTTDIISSAAFGIECNSLRNPDSEFRKFGRKIFELGKWKHLKRQMGNSLPKWFLDTIQMNPVDHETEDFFMEAVRSTVRYREENNVYRTDFMQLLLELRNNGKLSDDQGVSSVGKNDCNSQFLSLNEVAAQCFVFFVGGFESSAMTTTFTMLELARNQEIQDKLRTEITTVLEKYDQKLTYEGIMEMTYLDKIVHEALRLHPPGSGIGRICNSDYKIPGTDLLIEKGVRVLVPILALHRDPDHYPDPEVFDPERFNEENKAKRHPFAYIPFGEGPRMCIATRWGLLQTKVGIVAIIKDFSVTLNKKTQLPIKYAPKAVVTSVAGGIWLDLQSLQ